MSTFEISASELIRLKHMSAYELKARESGYRLIAGIDEAGRGPLAGPVVSAAVILNEEFLPAGIDDSKKLSAKKRESLYEIIKMNSVSYGIGIVDEKVIDEINILNATKLSMKIAVESMRIRPEFLLTDAVALGDVDIPQENIIKGDSLSVSIAAASILAKVSRDRIMTVYGGWYQAYGFAKHKGYGTKAHIEAIKKFGISPIHRVTYMKNIAF